MAAFDFPIDRLKQYKGVSPIPADFDEYWKDALRELESVNPDPELIPSSALAVKNSECFDLWFNGIGSARIHAQYVRPRRSRRGPAVLRFHGYSANAGDWADKLLWPSEGICVAAMDVRGQGGQSQDSGSYAGPTLRGHFVRGLADSDPRSLFFRSVFLDTVQLAKVIAGFDEVDEHRMGCVGASQGGALAIACAALASNIRRVYCVHPFLSDFLRVWQMDLVRDAYAELAEFFRWQDPTHVNKEEYFNRLGYIDVKNLAPWVQAKTEVAISMMDTVCPPSTQFAVFNNLNCDKSLVVYPNHGHEALPGMYDRMLSLMLDW